MELFIVAALSAIGTVTSGALSGAGGEMARRSSEALAGLVRRMRRENAAPGGEFTLPVTEDGRRELAHELWDHFRTSPAFADAAAEWLREAKWLAPRAVPAVAHGAARPQMLPPATAAFTDRESVPMEIEELLAGGNRPAGAPAAVVLVGPGGIGKTAAAVHSAHLLRERFPDGQLYVDLAGASAATAVSPSEVLVRFLDRLGVPPDRMPADEQRQGELYRDCTAGRRMVVLLDNASSDAQVRPLLPAASGCLVIITSRRRLDGLVADSGARHITLPPLSPVDSVRLLTRIAGRESTADEQTGALAVAEKCGGIPLALCATGAQFAVRQHLTWDAADRRLSEQANRRGRETFSMNDRTPTDPVHLATDVSYAELSPRCALLYRMAAVWAWPSITVAAAARAADLGEDEARALLEQLAAVHLLEEVGAERYRFHDLVRRHAVQRAEAEDGHAAMAAAARRMTTWYLGYAAEAEFRVIPSRWRLGPAYRHLTLPENRDPADGKAALGELRLEHDNLAAAVRAAEHYGFDEPVWQLCEAMWGFHLRLGFHQSWVDTHRRGAEAARRCVAEAFGDPRAEGRILVQLGFAYMGLGRLDEAEDAFMTAAAVDERAGHHRGQATAVEAQGLLQLKRWRGREAEQCFGQAQQILGRIRPGDDGEQDVPRALALLEHHIGRALRAQERLPDATRRLHEALGQFRALGAPDLYNEGRVHMSLGETHLTAGEPELARVCLDDAISTMGKEGAELQHADAAEMRARCARALGNGADEADDLRTAAVLYEKAADPVSTARVRARLEELPEES